MLKLSSDWLSSRRIGDCSTRTLLEALNDIQAELDLRKYVPEVCNKPQGITEPNWFVEDITVTQTEYCAGCEANRQPHSHVVAKQR